MGRSPREEDRAAAQNGLNEVQQLFAGDEFDLVVLDEANMATHLGLFPVEDLLTLIDKKPSRVELIITGREANSRVLERADLITEMREIRHYHAQGIGARKGIEL
jgi:cob(I)alamin adenosyltransferase